MKSLHHHFTAIWLANGLPASFLSHISFHGDPDLAVFSSFRLGVAASIAIGLSGLSAAYLHFLRTGVTQQVTVDARHAVLSFHSEAYYTIDGAKPSGDTWDSIAGLYRTAMDGWIRIHTNFPHHRAGVLSVLGIPDTPENPATKDAVRDAIAQWDPQQLEDTCAEKGLCVVRMRSLEKWEDSPQGKALALAAAPVVDIRQVAEAPVCAHSRSPTPSERPLDGMRVLDLSRVLAGPVAGRALAAHGAQVLLVTSPKLPDLPLLDVETSLGKRTTQIDLTERAGCDRLRALAASADVFLQAYRPGGLAAKGFGVDDVTGMKPGVVYASLSAWGWDGPWAGRRGFDSLVQTATGFNYDEGAMFMYHHTTQNIERHGIVPRALPMQALDHAAGYFLAFGINVALGRQLQSGGTHEVRVSLAGVGKWIRSLGRVPLEAFPADHRLPLLPKSADDEEIARLSVDWCERRGVNLQWRARRMTALRHAAVLAATPVREGIVPGEEPGEGRGDWGAPMRLDADAAVWAE